MADERTVGKMFNEQDLERMNAAMREAMGALAKFAEALVEAAESVSALPPAKAPCTCSHGAGDHLTDIGCVARVYLKNGDPLWPANSTACRCESATGTKPVPDLDVVYCDGFSDRVASPREGCAHMKSRHDANGCREFSTAGACRCTLPNGATS